MAIIKFSMVKSLWPCGLHLYPAFPVIFDPFYEHAFTRSHTDGGTAQQFVKKFIETASCSPVETHSACGNQQFDENCSMTGPKVRPGLPVHDPCSSLLPVCGGGGGSFS